jgi:pSer/pThr/pTyr-binding forkhead associated (FHA) protein
MASVFCEHCGHQNPDDSRFCTRCGAALRVAAEPEATDSTTTISLSGLEVDEPGDLASELLGEALPAGHALLVVQRGPSAGSRFLLDTEVTTAGRHPDSEIFLDDVTVSRRHATFTRTGDGFVVEDVGSLNGTYLNRERIERAPLHNGDEVQVGKYRLLFFASAPGDAS